MSDTGIYKYHSQDAICVKILIIIVHDFKVRSVILVFINTSVRMHIVSYWYL